METKVSTARIVIQCFETIHTSYRRSIAVLLISYNTVEEASWSRADENFQENSDSCLIYFTVTNISFFENCIIQRCLEE